MGFTPMVRYRNFTVDNLKSILSIYPDMIRKIKRYCKKEGFHFYIADSPELEQWQRHEHERGSKWEKKISGNRNKNRGDHHRISSAGRGFLLCDHGCIWGRRRGVFRYRVSQNEIGDDPPRTDPDRTKTGAGHGSRWRGNKGHGDLWSKRSEKGSDRGEQKNSKENFCLTFPQKRNIITFKRVAD